GGPTRGSFRYSTWITFTLRGTSRSGRSRSNAHGCRWWRRTTCRWWPMSASTPGGSERHMGAREPRAHSAFFVVRMDHRRKSRGGAQRFPMIVNRQARDVKRHRTRGRLRVDDDDNWTALDTVTKSSLAATRQPSCVQVGCYGSRFL